MPRIQTDDAQELYDERSGSYDDSHHPRFARHMVELIKPQPGEHVLDLACGTGLVSIPASEAIGPSGSVTGVDISSGMLAEADKKKSRDSLQNVSFHQHSITDLDSLAVIKGKTFDIITCCSALVLFPEPGDALKHWATYLKPGGRMIVDVTHPQNLTSGIVCERVGVRIGRPVPWFRLNFVKPEDLQHRMEVAGLQNVSITFMSQLYNGSEKLEDFILPSLSDPRVEREYEVSDADDVFDKMIDKTACKALASPPEVREKAREAFRDEWAKAANARGKVQEIDGIFMGIGYKA